MINKRQGFTLIEILIVVAIIAILASMVLVGLGPLQRRGRDARRLSDLRQLQNGLELYFAKNSAYPTPQGGSGAMAWADLSAAIVGAGPALGINSLPNDPASGAGKTYTYASDGTSYVLGATLEDTGNPALNDDIDGASVLGALDCTDPIYCLQL